MVPALVTPVHGLLQWLGVWAFKRCAFVEVVSPETEVANLLQRVPVDKAVVGLQNDVAAAEVESQAGKGLTGDVHGRPVKGPTR